MDTPTLTAMVVDYERGAPIAGEWYSETSHYFDLTLSARSAGSRGRFRDLFSDYERLGKVFLAPAGYRFHGAGGEGRQQSLYLYVRAEPLFEDEPELGQSIAPVLRNCLCIGDEVVRETLSRIAREVCQPSFASKVLVEGLGLTALGETARLLRIQQERSARKGGLPAWRMKLIEARVREGDGMPSVAELAQLCGLSRRQLSRAFREETGRTISSFIQDLTIEHAKTLLVETDRPINEVALGVGFAGAASFSVAFRRFTGESPRIFRTARRARRYAVLPKTHYAPKA
jgi:AraC family transcriptional regulator